MTKSLGYRQGILKKVTLIMLQACVSNEKNLLTIIRFSLK